MSDATEPKVWTFYSTGDAYDACQCNEEICEGDVLVIEEEKVVGIAGTWPCALTARHGELHLTTRDLRTYKGGKFAASIPIAEREAARIGVAILPRLTAPVVHALVGLNHLIGELLGIKTLVRRDEDDRQHVGWLIAGTTGFIELGTDLHIVNTGEWAPVDSNEKKG
jgi:hypothetical protein